MKKYRRTLPILTMLLLLSGCGVTKVTMETQSPIMATDAVMELPPTEVQRTTEAEETIPVWESLMEMDEASAEESAVPTETQTSIEAESCPPHQAQEMEQPAMEQTESPMTEPPLTETPITEQTEPILPTPTAEPEPPATEAPAEPSEAETAEITYEYKRQIASFVAQYLNSYRSSPCTVLSGMSQVAQYRASQLTWNFAHSTADKRAALAYYGYGRWVDATLAGLEESDSYYESDTAEAICRNFHGNTPEELGKAIADMIRNSSSHWSYVGSSEYSYMGIGVEYQNGWYLFVAQYTSSNLSTYAPQVLSNIGYDDYSPYLNGDETVADTTTASGKAPNIALFESNGLVCASFVSYYWNNYLPNIEGIDTTWVADAVKATTMNNGSYSTASVYAWETGLTNLANTPGSGVTRYTDATTAYANLVPGDVIIFSNSSGKLVHAAIYAGTYTMYNASGTNRGDYHYIIHVGNSRGPEISAVEYMVSAGAKGSTPSAWYHIELPEVQPTGWIEVNKKDTAGKNLSGAYFTAVDQGVGDKHIIGPTNVNGYAKSGELPLGTYVVTETVFPEGYEASGQSSWTVVLTKDTPNMTITINAVNKLKTGVAQIIKKATNGGTVAGWHFTVKDSNGAVVGNYTTDANGIIALNLNPGTYTVTETDGASQYWQNDPTPTQTITVKAGQTATVTYTNQYLGIAKIVKTTADGSSVAGWVFTIQNSSGTFVGKYTTDESGIITTKLAPGTYQITEELPEDSLWECVGVITRTVTVKAGETAEVTYTNRRKVTELTAYKVDTLGAPLSGAVFLLEWSEDGERWMPVTYSDSPISGGCTSSGLTGGKLESGKDGIVRFTGLDAKLYYRLTEVSAPDGYQRLTEPAWEGVLSGENGAEVTVVNAPVFELPMTGSVSGEICRVLQIMGASVILAMLLIAAKKRRK